MDNPVISILVVAVVAALAVAIWRFWPRPPSNGSGEVVDTDPIRVPSEDRDRPEPERAPGSQVETVQTEDRPPSVSMGGSQYPDDAPKSAGGDPKYGDDDPLERALRGLRRRTFFWENIEPTFRPLDAQPQELIDRGLQPLPDEQDPLQQQKLAFWKKMYGPPFQWVQADYLPLVGEQFLQPVQFRLISRATLQESSRNWSGLYISPRDGRMLVEVRGEWNVPTVNFPIPALPAVNERRSSTWIGFDGQRRYFDSSLPQIGTEQFIVDTLGTVTRPLGCFMQWWLREDPQPPVPLPLTINAGNIIMASITIISPTEVIFYIKNQSTGDFLTPWKVDSPEAPMPSGPTPIQVRVPGATAEWVMERPMVWASDDLYEMPSFNTVEFQNCSATSALAPGGFGRDETLYGARRISMRRLEHNPPQLRALTVSEPHSIVWPPREQEPFSFDVDFRP